MSGMPDPIKMPRTEQPSKQARNRSSTRRNWSKVEEYLTGIEKARGFAKAWELRERLERGDVTLDELTGR
jgi:hypothetical protein